MSTNKSLAKNAIYNILYKVLNVIFPLISTAYVSRVLLSDGIGRVSAATNNVSYFLILSTLGIPAYGLREIAKCRNSRNEKNKLFSELFVANLLLTFFAFIIYCILVLSIPYFKQELSLYIIFGFSIILNILNVDWLYQGSEEYQYIAIRSTLIKVISIIAILIFVKEKKDIYVFAIIQVLATSGNYILNIIRAKKLVSFSVKDLDLKKHIKPLAYLAFCSISTELYAKIDISMLDVIKGSSIVGYYTSSQKIINLIISALVAVTAVFMPRLSFLFDNDKKEFNKILNRGLELMIVISIPSCLGIATISKLIVLSILGENFYSAWLIVSILSFMIPLKCIGDIICYQVMMCARKEKILMRSYIVTLIINLINNFLLIPKFGAEGAAIASVISEIVAFLFVLYYSKRMFVTNMIARLLVKTLIATACMILIIYLINKFEMNCYASMIISVIVGLMSFIAVSIVIKNKVIIESLNAIKLKYQNRLITK